MSKVNFKPRGEIVLLEVHVVKKTERGIDLPERSYYIDLNKPMKVAAVGDDVTNIKEGTTVILDSKPAGEMGDIQFNIPGDGRDYIIVPEGFIAGTLVNDK